MTTDAREANIIRSLRGLALVAVALAMLAVVLDRRCALVAGALCIPSGWVYWRPRAGQVALWAMWTLPIVMLAVIVHLDRTERLRTPSSLLIGSAFVTIAIAMPLLRWSRRRPRARRVKVPRARVVP